jgi:acetyl-CoA carboxylase biotin carboxylase subunit
MKTIHTILIANRGEIACRIIRTCKKLGIRSVAVYSDADAAAPFVRMADVALHIGGNNLAESYLNVEKLLDAAKRSGADAIHPGYGFLSENAGFARAVAAAGFTFIGPNPEAIDAMGSKSEAKRLMMKHGVPVIPGYQGADQSTDTLVKEAKNVGFPLLLKAAAGGGGKGMRIVNEAKELESAIDSAKREAKSSFGNDELIIEKYFPSARHVEFQIFGDKHGNAIHLLERECSIQRRYQKIVEESPSPALTAETRDKMGEAAVRAAKSLNYDNAGTVEFILTETGDFFFLEVNTRLQVEHPVTEEVTGLDLVEMQIASAEGRPLAIAQEEVKGNGYAIEVRLYAEDADRDFVPATGTILDWHVPAMEGLRVETGVETGSEISVHYDPMIAKLIAHGRDRAEAQRKMLHTLRNLRCLGLTTNQDFLIRLLEHEEFQAGNYDTHFLKHAQLELTVPNADTIQMMAIAATAFQWYGRETQRTSLHHLPSGWRNSFYQGQMETYLIGEEELAVSYRNERCTLSFTIGETQRAVRLLSCGKDSVRLDIDGVQQEFHVAQSGAEFFLRNAQFGSLKLTLKDRFPIKEPEKLAGGYASPMPGQVVKVLVQKGDTVTNGQGLIVLSSMKMENTICAQEDGVVEDVYVQDGQFVEAGMLMLKLES